MTPTAPSRRMYWAGLDGIRAVMMLLVFLAHLPLRHWRGGYVALDVFFCMSGFLITTLICTDADAAGRVDVRRFYLRRFVRLYPAMLLGLVVAGVLMLSSSKYHLDAFVTDAVTAVTYTFNLHMIFDSQRSTIGQYWSLAVEEQYYLIWAAVMLLLHRRVGLGRRALTLAAGALVVLVTVKGVVLLASPLKASHYAYFLLPGHADELLLGGVLALAVRSRNLTIRSPWAAAAAGAALVVMAFRLSDVPSRHGAVVVWLLAAALGGVVIVHVATAPDSPLTRFLTLAPLRWAGKRSYGWYCYHVAVIHLCLEAFGRRALVVGPVAAVATLTLAGLSWKYVEEPALRWRDRDTAREPVPALA